MLLDAKCYAILALFALFGESFSMPQVMAPDSESTILGESMSPYGVRRTETKIFNGLYGGQSESGDLPYAQQPLDSVFSYRRKRDVFGYPAWGMGGLPIDATRISSGLYGGQRQDEFLPYMRQPVESVLPYMRQPVESVLPYMRQPIESALPYRRKRNVFGYPNEIPVGEI